MSSQPSNNVFSKGAAKNANTNEICAAASMELGPLYIVLSDIKNKQTKNHQPTRVSHLVSFKSEEALRVQKQSS